MPYAQDEPVDARGRPTTKLCGKCGARATRVARKCETCGTEFLSKNKAWRIRQKVEADVRAEAAASHRNLLAGKANGEAGPKREPVARTIAPAGKPKRPVAVAVQALYTMPVDAEFVCLATPSGGMVLSWPKLDIRVTLTKGERDKFRVADRLT